VAFPTDLRIEWSVDHESTDPRLRQSAIVDPDDLERSLDQLGEEAAATEPFIAELVKSAGARLGIGLGTPGSVLSFKESDEPPYFVSVGRPDALDKDVGFYFQGRWSEFSERSLVPLELARKAARQFLSTGQRPDVVEWEEV
jgi:hypothetical protein